MLRSNCENLHKCGSTLSTLDTSYQLQSESLIVQSEVNDSHVPSRTYIAINHHLLAETTTNNFKSYSSVGRKFITLRAKGGHKRPQKKINQTQTYMKDPPEVTEKLHLKKKGHLHKLQLRKPDCPPQGV